MKEFGGKVAVITGAASGIGRALTQKAAAHHMKLMLADIEAEPLARTVAELKAEGAEVVALQTDVSKAEEIERLAAHTMSSYGAVHLLFNNAGVGGPDGNLWENTLADFQWVLGVNLWSVIHGIRAFVPLMLAQNTEGHIVNTASLAGLVSYPSSGIYQLSKHGVVALSETLHHELTQKEAKIKVSVLCPAWVNTRIFESDRNRPAELSNPTAETVSPDNAQLSQGFRYAVQHGKAPQEVAEKVFEAIEQEKFYILTHPRSKTQIESRMQDILLERNPGNPITQANIK